MKYRFGGKEKRLSLGVYPDASLKDARDRRDAARKLLSDGIDPSENRKAQKATRQDRAANSFEVVTREWYAKHSPNWAEHHGDRIIRRLAHAVKDPNGRAYNRTAHLPERRKMMQQWADYLDKLKAGADVISLRGQAA